MDLAESLAHHREELAGELRTRRAAAKVSGTELARRLGWSQSRVSRIETGRQIPDADEIRSIAKALGFSASVVKELLAHLEGLDREWSDIRTTQAFGSEHRQVEIKETEARVKEIRVFQPALIPGLLQTPDYTRSLALTSGVLKEADIDADIEVRAERQAKLADKSKTFTFIVTEAALWYRYGSGFVMQEQYERLLASFGAKTVRLGVIPRSTKMPILPMTGFNIYGDELVTVETITSQLVFRHPSDVTEYRRLFDMLTSTAATGTEARRVIEEAAAFLT